MLANIQEFVDRLFKEGIEQGDILWFLDKYIRKTTKNCAYFTIALTLTIFCSIEVVCQIYMLTEKPTILQILTFGPMFFTSIHALTSVVPLVVQRYSYKQLYDDYVHLWSLKSADKKGLEEIRDVFKKALIIIGFFTTAGIIASMGYMPFTGVDYDKSVFPAIAALKLIEGGSKSVINFIIVANFLLVFAKAYFLCVYGLHLMHITVLYDVQNILLRRRLNRIRCAEKTVSPLKLIENKKYQMWVQKELKECIKLDVKLKRFSEFVISYFKWVGLVHVGNAICVLTMLYYINFFLNGGFSPLGSRCFVVGANMMAVTYAYCSEVFYEQVDLNRVALCNTPWNTFNVPNRKLVLIFLSNLRRPKFLSAGGIADINYSLLIFVMHKSFNFLTVLAQMTPEAETE